jgi:lipid-A-disaccharide synthase
VGEAGRIFPTLLDAAVLLGRAHPGAQFAVPKARTIPDGFLESLVAPRSLAGLAIREEAYPGLLDVADAGAVASGTATLDAALAGLPFVAVYRMQALSYLVAKALVRVDHVALPNVISGARIVPELVQGAFTPGSVAEALAGWLDHPAEAAAMRSKLSGVAAQLCGEGAFDRAAAAVLDEVEQVCSNPALS